MLGDAAAHRFELGRFERRDTRISAQLARLWLKGRFIDRDAEELAKNAVLVVVRAGEELARVPPRPGSVKMTRSEQGVEWSASFAIRQSLLAGPRTATFEIGLDHSTSVGLPAPWWILDTDPSRTAAWAGTRTASANGKEPVSDTAPAAPLNGADARPTPSPRPRRHHGSRTRPTRFIRAFPQRVAVVAICALAAAGGAGGGLLRAPNRYQARALLVVTPVSAQDPDFEGVAILRSHGDPTPALQSALGIVGQSAVAQLTADRMGPGWSEQQVASSVHVALEPTSNLIDVTAAAGSPATASKLANRYADSALALRARELQPSLRAALDSARAEVLGLGRARTPASIDAGRRLAVLTAMQGRGDPTIQTARGAVALSRRGRSYELEILVLALAAGGVLGLSSAWLIGRSGPRAIPDERRIRHLAGLPVLARLPLDRAASPKGIASFTHEMRGLLTLLEIDGDRATTIAVVSPSPGDGKTTVATALANHLAQRGETVALLDLDSRKGDAHVRVGVAPPRRAMMLLPSPIAQTLTVGGVWAGAGTEQAGESIDHARTVADRVVIDTPALGVTRDGLVAASRADAVLTVVTLGHTQEQALVEAHELLMRASAHPAGVVLLVPGRGAARR